MLSIHIYVDLISRLVGVILGIPCDTQVILINSEQNMIVFIRELETQWLAIQTIYSAGSTISR